MVIKKINCTGENMSLDELVKSGNFFSGTVSLINKNSWLEFNLVNREKLKYILSNTVFNKEVQFEILTYDEYPEKIQYDDNWDKIDKK
jgi:hypothetical protein|tara:strand:+ start:642 stop:905 length:264 start_codon:yes stop_codon:yes gene_type:complete